MDEGNTLTDFDEEEIQRKITISTALAAVEWNKKKINLIDTPGFNIFINDTNAALVAADAALILVDGVAGVEVQTEKVWSFAEKLQAAARLRDQQARSRALQLRPRAGERPFRLRPQPPFPSNCRIGSERDFKGVIDLVRMKAYYLHARWRRQGQGERHPGRHGRRRAEGARSAGRNGGRRQRRALEEFFAEGTLPVEHIIDGLLQAIRDDRIYPVLCASALHNIGSDLMLNFINEYFPAPAERGPVDGPLQRQRDAARRSRTTSPSRPSSSRPSPIRSRAACPISK